MEQDKFQLDDETKELVKHALESHRHCVHNDPELCKVLILSEVALYRGEPPSNEEIIAIGYFLADTILEQLILKGMVEVSGISEDGDFMVALTEQGRAAIIETLTSSDEEE
jgi:hypothetical protein